MSKIYGTTYRHVHKNSKGKRVPSSSTVLNRFRGSRDLMLWAGIHAWNTESELVYPDEQTIGQITSWSIIESINGYPPTKSSLYSLASSEFSDNSKEQNEEIVETIIDSVNSFSDWMKFFKVTFEPETPLVCNSLNFGVIVHPITFSKNRNQSKGIFSLAITHDSETDQEIAMWANVIAMQESIDTWQKDLEAGCWMLRIDNELGTIKLSMMPWQSLQRYRVPLKELRLSYDIFKDTKRAVQKYRPKTPKIPLKKTSKKEAQIATEAMSKILERRKKREVEPVKRSKKKPARKPPKK